MSLLKFLCLFMFAMMITVLTQKNTLASDSGTIVKKSEMTKVFADDDEEEDDDSNDEEEED